MCALLHPGGCSNAFHTLKHEDLLGLIFNVIMYWIIASVIGFAQTLGGMKLVNEMTL